jgi:hypothetical protein
MSEMLLDRAGRRRSPATMPGFHAGRPPRNKGLRYPADPPKVEEIVAVMRTAGDGAHGRRLRGLIVVLWRAGLRIQEALGLAEADLDYRRGALLVRRGKGGRRREVGINAWGWDELQPWLELRVGLPVGPLFCVLNGRTRGRQWSTAAARAELRRTAVTAGVRRRFAPHQLRHAHAVEMAREGVPLVVIQRQLGHSNLGITSVYLQGIDNAEIIDSVAHRAKGQRRHEAPSVVGVCAVRSADQILERVRACWHVDPALDGRQCPVGWRDRLLLQAGSGHECAQKSVEAIVRGLQQRRIRAFEAEPVRPAHEAVNDLRAHSRIVLGFVGGTGRQAPRPETELAKRGVRVGLADRACHAAPIDRQI